MAEKYGHLILKVCLHCTHNAHSTHIDCVLTDALVNAHPRALDPICIGRWAEVDSNRFEARNVGLELIMFEVINTSRL